MTRRDRYGLAVAPLAGARSGQLLEVIPRRRHVGRGRFSTRAAWMASNLIAFDESSANPLVNLGTLGAAGDATATGTRRLVNTGSGAVVQLPGVIGNFLSVPAAAGGPLDITGPIFIGAEVALTDWTPSTRQTIAAKWNGSLPGSSWQFAVNTSAGPDTAGALQFRWYSASNVLTTVSTGSTAVGAVDGSWRFVGIDLGASAAQFYTSDDGATWTPLGSPVATAGVPDIASNSTDIRFGQRDTEPMGGGVRRGIIRAGGIGGTTVLDIDPSVLTDEGATSFTARTGQTVNINRASGGAPRSEIVVPGSRSRSFGGVSDYLEVAHNAALELGTSGQLTPWIVARVWPSTVSSGPYLSKRDGNSPNAGWNVISNGSAQTFAAVVDEGASQVNRISSSALGNGALAFFGAVMDRNAQTLRTFIDAELFSGVSLSALGSVANGLPVRLGRNPNLASGGQSFRCYAWGVYGGAPSAAQLAAVREVAVAA